MKPTEIAAHEVVLATRAVRNAEAAALAGMRNLADFTELCRLSESLIEADRSLALARATLLRKARMPA